MATITKSLIQKRLIIANCCAAKKGYNYIVNYLEKGKSSKKELNSIKLLTSLIDSILVYTNQYNNSDIIEGNTCISKAQVENILNKLCQICDDPCQTYVNFS